MLNNYKNMKAKDKLWKRLPSGVYVNIDEKGTVSVLTENEFHEHCEHISWWDKVLKKYFK